LVDIGVFNAHYYVLFVKILLLDDAVNA